MDIFAKLNVPQEEVDVFTDQVKERKMGELFKHFEGWDVQALRQEIKDAKEEAEKKTEEGIQKLFNILKNCNISQDEAVTQLMAEYQFSADEAKEKIKLYW